MRNPKTSATAAARLLLSLLLLFLLLTTNTGCWAKKSPKNRQAPHPYRAELTPYQPGPFANLQLSAADEIKLAQGEAVMKQQPPPAADDEKRAPGGSAICVQHVNAPVDAVWYQILDFDHYSDKVSKIRECDNYHVLKYEGIDGQCCFNIKTKQVLGVLPGYSYESYYNHTYHPDQGSLTWTLDYDKTSDLRDCVGHWHVTPVNETVTRVYYACDLQMQGSPPKTIMNYISKAALKQATAWVKRESEAHPEKTIPVEYSGGGATTSATATRPDERQKTLIVAAGRTRFWGRR